MNRSNILFIFSDQQRWDTLGCCGSPIFEGLTPNLDRLAGEGVLFRNAFTCQPVCGPARAALQTGKYATETTCHVNGISLPRREKTLAHWLSDTGYEVGYIGKWHLASDRKGLAGVQPFSCRTSPVPLDRRGGYNDCWLASDILEFTSDGFSGHMFDGEGNTRDFPEGRYRVDAQTDWALEYLRTRDGEKPFFLFLSYIEPHHQNNHNRFEGPHGSKERFRNYSVPGDLDGLEGDWQEQMPDYLGCCSSLDQNVGRILKELERLGIEENTLVIYTSDHGCHFRTRNSEYKRACHDSTIRIPLVIKGPGFVGGRQFDETVSLLDLTPTVLEAGGARLPDYLRGSPLQRLAADKAAKWPDDVFVQISESQVGRAIRTRKWKYAVTAPDKHPFNDSFSDVYVEDFLYDLEDDPHERNNLVTNPDFGKVRKELAERLLRRMVEVGEEKPLINPKNE